MFDGVGVGAGEEDFLGGFGLGAEGEVGVGEFALLIPGGELLFGGSDVVGILSKAFLLAEDGKIKDSSILGQIRLG